MNSINLALNTVILVSLLHKVGFLKIIPEYQKLTTLYFSNHWIVRHWLIKVRALCEWCMEWFKFSLICFPGIWVPLAQELFCKFHHFAILVSIAPLSNYFSIKNGVNLVHLPMSPKFYNILVPGNQVNETNYFQV